MGNNLVFRGITVIYNITNHVLNNAKMNVTNSIILANDIKNTLRNETNPSLAISLFYSVFLYFKDYKVARSNNQFILAIDSVIKEFFNVIKNREDQDYSVAKGVKNAIANYRIQLICREGQNYLLFRDRMKNPFKCQMNSINEFDNDNYEFVAEISCSDLWALIGDIIEDD